MKKKSGYTLVELLTVVGIVGLIAAVALPSVMSTMPERRMKEAMWRVYIDLEHAKARAVSENVEVVIEVDGALDRYSLWADTNGNGTREEREVTVRSLADLAGIDLEAFPARCTIRPTGTLETTSYFMRFKLSGASVNERNVYIFPNGHVDAYRMQHQS